MLYYPSLEKIKDIKSKALGKAEPHVALNSVIYFTKF